jgi:hypothetical protein
LQFGTQSTGSNIDPKSAAIRVTAQCGGQASIHAATKVAEEVL